MPRPLRIEIENGWYHVMNRGASYKEIFKSDRQRIIFIDLLAEAVSLFGVKVHSYCLMDNHYHLLLQTPRGNLAKVMRYLNGVYTQRHNRLQKIDGALFRGRYKAILIDKDNYLLEVSRYIHNNPVMAKMCSYSYQYNWSSSQFYCGKSKCPNWLVTEAVLSMISGQNRSLAYMEFMRAGVNEEITEFYKKCYTSSILGDKRFKDKYLNLLDEKIIDACKADYNRTQELPSMEYIISKCKEFFNVSEEMIFRSGRKEANYYRKMSMYACRHWGCITLREIAQRFNCKAYANVGKMVNSVRLQLQHDSKLGEILAALKKLVLVKNE